MRSEHQNTGLLQPVHNVNVRLASRLLKFDNRSKAFVLKVGICSSVQMYVLWNTSEHQVTVFSYVSRCGGLICSIGAVFKTWYLAWLAHLQYKSFLFDLTKWSVWLL